ncbi:MAG: DUF5655 domain-containing protein [Saprospiraceae bacterium]|nr:DUF5655 domain-containing protein [Saprospiraceae bacterium]
MPGLWTCPTCHAQFATPNQWHSCLRKELDAHFTGRPDAFVLIFDEITRLFDGLGGYRIRSVPSAIIFKRKSSFAALKFQKKAVIVEWMTNRLIDDDERISRTLQTSASKYAHVVKITHPDEVDETLRAYLEEAYRIAPPF